MSNIVPAVLPSSRKELEGKLALIAKATSASRVQIEVVDGHVATPTSWPYVVPGELHAMVERGEMLPLLDRFEYEVDLMCTDIEQAVEDWLALGATRLTFHFEGMTDPLRLLAKMRRQYGSDPLSTTGVVSLGLAIDLATDLARVEPCLTHVSYVQCMGIATIGRQGAPFDARVLGKVRELHTRHPDLELQVDGGVSIENAKSVLMAGASFLVVGSAILGASDPTSAFLALESCKSPYGV